MATILRKSVSKNSVCRRACRKTRGKKGAAEEAGETPNRGTKTKNKLLREPFLTSNLQQYSAVFCRCLPWSDIYLPQRRTMSNGERTGKEKETKD